MESGGALLALTSLFSGFLAIVVAWAKSVMQDMQTRIERLEKEISDCHGERNAQNLIIGRLEATVESLKHQIRYNVDKRRNPVNDEGFPK